MQHLPTVRVLYPRHLYSFEQKRFAASLALALWAYYGRGPLLVCEPPANASKKA